MLFNIQGENVHCAARNPNNIYDVAFGSKDQLLQIWNLKESKEKPKWLARNLPNDHLDLKIPIWDTDIEWLSRTNQYSLVTCTAYCDVREYDTRGPRKPVHNSKVFSQNDGKDGFQLKEMYLTKIL